MLTFFCFFIAAIAGLSSATIEMASPSLLAAAVAVTFFVLGLSSLVVDIYTRLTQGRGRAEDRARRVGWPDRASLVR